MMKKVMIGVVILLSLVILNCSKKTITNNYYPSPDKGIIVGYVYPSGSEAVIYAYLGNEVTSSHIDTSGYFKLTNMSPGGYTISVKAEGYIDYYAYVWLPSAVTVSAGTITLSSVHDLVQYAWPYDGAEEVDLDSRIRVSFRNQMNIKSVEDAFQITPEVEGNFYWYSGGRSAFEFIPKNQFAAHTTYHVTIDSTASDTGGNSLSKPYQFSFTTVPIRIMYTYPQNQETWVDTNTNVSISFNADMDAESVVLAFKMVDSKLKDVSGKFFWSYRRYMRFVPDSTLTPNETYTVTIDTNAKALAGGSLEESYNFWFKTSPY